MRGTPNSMASATVQRPSPESATYGAMPCERRILLQGIRGQIEQPGAHDAAVAPDFGDLVQVELELALVLQDREAFGVGLHQSVLDAVVDHLGVVAGADRPDAAPAPIRRRRQRLENRAQALDHGLVAADHQAIALGEPPHAAAGARIDVVNLTLRHGGGAPLRIAIIRIAAVDDGVARREQRRESGDRAVGDRPGGHHQPDRARRLEFGDQLFERGGRLRALLLRARRGPPPPDRSRRPCGRRASIAAPCWRPCGPSRSLQFA